MMGCLFQLFFEVLIEGVLDIVMFLYLKIAHLLVPDKKLSEKTKNTIKDCITTVCVVLALILFLGVIFLLPNDKAFNMIGKYMVFISLSIIGVQFFCGIIVVIVRYIKRKN